MPGILLSILHAWFYLIFTAVLGDMCYHLQIQQFRTFEMLTKSPRVQSQIMELGFKPRLTRSKACVLLITTSHFVLYSKTKDSDNDSNNSSSNK